MDIQQVAQEMRPVVYQAGEIAKKHFMNVKADRKPDRSFVTAADREIETFLKEEIARRFPDHGVIGEEYGKHQLDGAENIWALDPIDGTAPFVYELPVWCISVGLLHRGKPVLGFVYLPVVDELFWAIAGGPAFVNEREINVCEARDMIRGTCIVAPSITFRGLKTQYDGRALAFGSAAAHICFVARGKIHGGILMKVRLWDIAASAVVLSAAGGEMTYLSGRPVDVGELVDGRQVPEPFCVGNPENVRQLRTLFRELGDPEED